MKSWIFFSGTRDINPNPEADDPLVGETSGGGEAPAAEEAESSIEREAVAGTADGESDATSTPTTSGEGERRRALMEKPPTDDVCPICFGVLTFRAGLLVVTGTAAVVFCSTGTLVLQCSHASVLCARSS
ncbi:UNVERIFIED_CONTAM: hypothetical protein Sangu_0601400 [Sesamum angustifolium]|uniref:Uncharacterized protein n=1 Tax=Sesamum angustifolium TaxID=2727405 RepID=A0AAW2QB86_9LAMI